MRKCPHCGYSIYDSEIVFCPSCKGLIDKNLNLINDIDKLLYQYDRHDSKTKNTIIEETIPEEKKIQNDTDSVIEIKQEKQKSNTIYIILILMIIIIKIFVIIK